MPITRYGFDVNQPGASNYPRFATRTVAPYKTGQVVDIILDRRNPDFAEDGSNVGFAKIRLVPSDISDSEESLGWVAPLESNIRQYPLIGEMVQVIYVGAKLTYKLIGTDNKITKNGFLLLDAVSTLETPNENLDIEASLIASGVRVPQEKPEPPNTGLTLPFTKGIQPKEGDILIQGRFGNSIRLGSSKFQPRTESDNVPSPNLLLSVGSWSTPTAAGDTPELSTDKIDTEYSLVYEDINNNKTCLWMVANQQVDFSAATKDSTAHLRGADITRTNPWYTGAQIFANSDRIIINSKVNEIALFSNTEINLSALKTISVSSANNISMVSDVDVTIKAGDDIFIKGKNISIIGKTNFSNDVKGNYTILGKKIFIGATTGDITQPMVLGSTLALWLQALVSALITPGSVLTSTGPAQFNPAVIALLNSLKSQLGTPATPFAAVFNSKDNFTTKNNRVNE